VVTSAVNGIEVRANEVTIDMGGFTLAGSGVGQQRRHQFQSNDPGDERNRSRVHQ
jgi:hypothetical protein